MNDEEKMKRLKRMLLIKEEDKLFDLNLKDALEEAEFVSLHIAEKIFRASVIDITRTRS